ncbi:MAG: CDP-diacylglycerol--serine O-phosphatidyltransferase [Pseudomonadota bacterium]
METPFPPFDPEGEANKPVVDGEDGEATGRLRDVPLRVIVPNFITLMAICSGLTAMRMAMEGRFQMAILAVLFAAILDALDGRIARLLKSTTRFGAQMDSLADFVNFGVAPALVLYAYVLNDAGSIGWIAALIYAICGSLRLARFNVMLDDPNRPDWMADYFTGVPAPAGAMIVLLPIYVGFLGVDLSGDYSFLVAGYIIFVGLLMVSNLPTYAGKNATQRIPRQWVLPIMILTVLCVAILFSYPWKAMAAVSIGYILLLPIGRQAYQRALRRDAAAVSSEKESGN